MNKLILSGQIVSKPYKINRIFSKICFSKILEASISVSTDPPPPLCVHMQTVQTPRYVKHVEWKGKCEGCFPHMLRKKNLQQAIKNLVKGKVSEVMLQGKR